MIDGRWLSYIRSSSPISSTESVLSMAGASTSRTPRPVVGIASARIVVVVGHEIARSSGCMSVFRFRVTRWLVNDTEIFGMRSTGGIVFQSGCDRFTTRFQTSVFRGILKPCVKWGQANQQYLSKMTCLITFNEDFVPTIQILSCPFNSILCLPHSM
ncbi:hypothetical protein M408DRAFT_129773 [Serendipita vermifera MAFF 305830]|uniref:Uncharacterized protein n=1 Tax=Serendipita vermifera MAFF 305830 TaxID=933852 RepID=A0A0C3AKP3_SERVB|nr:hypothetical protein M408DRAFT_129773 [Serendipita vermifera MAFF 305830]